MAGKMTARHITSRRDRASAKYRRLHLRLALEISLDQLKSEPSKQERKRENSLAFRNGQM